MGRSVSECCLHGREVKGELGEVCVCVCVCVRACVRACIRACVRACMRACVCDVDLSLVHNAPQGAALRCIALRSYELL